MCSTVQGAHITWDFQWGEVKKQLALAQGKGKQ
jgi:hypothetical protein